MTEKLWTIKDVAGYYRVTRRTIERWRKAGKLPEPTPWPGRGLRWRAEDVRDGNSPKLSHRHNAT